MINKMIAILEFFLSLHEADEIYNMIFDEEFTSDDIIEKLKLYHVGKQ
jgi:hypothetical protein